MIHKHPGVWLSKLPLLVALLIAGVGGLQAAAAGDKVPLSIRGRAQEVYAYPAPGDQTKGPILLMPGDGGWRGFAVTLAEVLSGNGFDVFGFDTRHYLESFTTSRSALRDVDVMADMRFLAEAVRKRPNDRVILVGWSEGAGLAVVASSAAENRQAFRGVVTIGLPGYAVLGWRWPDNITYVTKRKPDEPSLETKAYLPKIAPLPLLMIHSSGDEYTGAGFERQLFEAAREPKRFLLVEAQNHRFDGNRDEFFRHLREGLAWMTSINR